MFDSNSQAVAGASSLGNPVVSKPPHFVPRAKNVIQLFMTGGPSHLDMFDYKPTLGERDGQPLPDSVRRGVRFEQIRDAHPLLMGSRWKFRRCGQSGQWVATELLPHMSRVVDDLMFVRTVVTEETVHPRAEYLLNTGHRVAGRPSLGAWLLYGLGSESDNLPGYVVINSNGPTQGKQGNYHNGFLPSTFHGIELRSRGEPILNITNPRGVTATDQRQVVDAINKLNVLGQQRSGDPEIAARIAAYELAFLMQSAAPELANLADESPATLALYGTDGKSPSLGRDCLLARRMVERGVRFVQIHYRDWDHHENIVREHPIMCQAIDRACAALVHDLKQRGLLDETLVIWGGEFGRTPVAQPQKEKIGQAGRDHHVNAFTMWLAGGGVKAGASVGETDEFGFHPVKDPVHVHDLQATILHLLGVDHEQLTYRYQGRDFRLTDVYGHVVEKMLA